ncbi:MAG: NAD(P)/FAD-dependent oxidoreductase [Hyphomicrobiaceae bacterium]|nr:NAD(P)/FAD-dependent oxidoreductase [Hyphomicrobiaceae bacterium]MCC0008109.1 NAD(P)/FAD-dependent oxidoreductase [Hyphomicrobiaceae bacterium]
MNYVVLGAGPAGVTAAETLRSLDKASSITIINGEDEPQPYSRMAIPYYIYGKIDEHGTYLRQTPGHYEKLGITYKVGRCGGIDPAAHKVYLTGGEALSYDKLLIATGASPIIPRMPGSNLTGVHTCWTLNDAREILKHADKGSPVVLVGAGFIGSIILEALYLRGCKITIVEYAPRMVARMMDETAGGMLGRWCKAKGVDVRVSTKVEGIHEGSDAPGAKLTVELSDGTTVPAALVVLAVGVRSNTGFLVGTGIATNVGITVDQHLQTTAPDIYAAGDCCEGVDLSTGKPDMLAIQPVAVEHGRLAALNMAGHSTPHRGSLNMNVLDTMGLISSSFGLWQGTPLGKTARLIDEDGFKYLKLEFEGDKLVGAQCVGMTDHVGMLRGLIQSGFHLGNWRDRLLAAPERLREAYIDVMQSRPGFGPSAPHTNTPIAKSA